MELILPIDGECFIYPNLTNCCNASLAEAFKILGK